MANRILLADDSITIQKVVNLTFADEGIEVVTVSNGDMAERRMSEVNPDLVLADIFMPGKNGYELCQYVKENPDFKNVPVVLLVGAFEPFDQAEARRVKADAHLTKPFESRTLVDTVRNLIEASKPARQAPVTTKRLEHRETFDTKPLDPLAFQSDAFQEADPLDSTFKPQTPDFGFNPREAFGGTAALEDPLSLDDGQSWLREKAPPAAPTFDHTLSFEAPSATQFAPPQPSGAFQSEQAGASSGSQDLSFLESTDPFASADPAASSPQPRTGGAYEGSGFAFVEAQSATQTDHATDGKPEIAKAASEDNPLGDVLIEAPGDEKGAALVGFDLAADSGTPVPSEDFTIEAGASFEILTNPMEATEPEPAAFSTGGTPSSDFAISSIEFGTNGSASPEGSKEQSSFDATPITLESSTFSAVDVDFEPQPIKTESEETGAAFEMSTESGFAVEPEKPRSSEGFEPGQGFEIAAFTSEADVIGSSSDGVQFTTSDMWSQPETHFAPVEFESPSTPAHKWEEEPAPAFEMSTAAAEPATEIAFEQTAEEPAEAKADSHDAGFAFFPTPEPEPKESPSHESASTVHETSLPVHEPSVPALAVAQAPSLEVEAIASTVAGQIETPPAPAMESSAPQPASVVSEEEVAAASQITVSKAVIDEIVRRVVSEITESVVKEIAWEVVPDAVERVIERMARESVAKR